MQIHSLTDAICDYRRGGDVYVTLRYYVVHTHLESSISMPK